MHPISARTHRPVLPLTLQVKVVEDESRFCVAKESIVLTLLLLPCLLGLHSVRRADVCLAGRPR